MNDFSAIGYLDYMWVISGGEDSMTGCYKYKKSSCLNIGCNYLGGGNSTPRRLVQKGHHG